MNQNFPDLSPTQRIPKVIQTFLFPHFEKYGFTISKSGLTFKKSAKEFVYALNAYKNQRNCENVVCAFEIWANVSSPTYNRWHRFAYHQPILNTHIISNRIGSLPNSTLKPTQLDFDLAQQDNIFIIESIKENIEPSILPFLLQVTSWETTIQAVQKEEEFFKIPMLLDFCEILQNQELGKKTLAWFTESTDRTEYDHIEQEFFIREERLKKGYR